MSAPRTVITAAASGAALSFALVGCGSHTTATSSTPGASITKAQAAKRYLADVAAGNAVANTLSGELTSSTSSAHLRSDGVPFIRVTRRLDPKLAALAGEYPPAAASLKAEIGADKALITDFAQGSEASLSEDIQANQSAVDLVRSDLGLSRK
jgi:hypothetical protein